MSSFSKSRLSWVCLACVALAGCPVDERSLELRGAGARAGSNPGGSPGYAGLSGVGAEGGDDTAQTGGAGSTDAGGADDGSVAGSTSGSGGNAGNGGSSGNGGGGGIAGQVSGQGGAGGEGSEPETGCGDLDHNQVQDCEETLVQNAAFDTNDAAWVADSKLSQSWSAQNARPGQTSGSVVIVNSTVLDQDGAIVGGSGQCLAATGDETYQVAARAFIQSGQGEGTASIALWFYGSANCASYLLGSLGPTPVVATDKWTPMQGAVKAPPAALSMRVVLQASKPFKQAKLQAQFDDVLVHRQ